MALQPQKKILSSEAGVNYTYGDTNHNHAVTAMGEDSYNYDNYGNQVNRNVAGSSYTLSYDAENRTTNVQVARLVGMSSGAKNSEIRYMPWGTTRYTYGTSPTTYQYTGQRVEDYIKLYWFGSRWYDDQLGRWIQPDWIVPEAAQGVQACALVHVECY